MPDFEDVSFRILISAKVAHLDDKYSAHLGVRASYAGDCLGNNNSSKFIMMNKSRIISMCSMRHGIKAIFKRVI